VRSKSSQRFRNVSQILASGRDPNVHKLSPPVMLRVLSVAERGEWLVDWPVRPRQATGNHAASAMAPILMQCGECFRHVFRNWAALVCLPNFRRAACLRRHTPSEARGKDDAPRLQGHRRARRPGTSSANALTSRAGPHGSSRSQTPRHEPGGRPVASIGKYVQRRGAGRVAGGLHVLGGSERTTPVGAPCSHCSRLIGAHVAFLGPFRFQAQLSVVRPDVPRTTGTPADHWATTSSSAQDRPATHITPRLRAHATFRRSVTRSHRHPPWAPARAVAVFSSTGSRKLSRTPPGGRESALHIHSVLAKLRHRRGGHLPHGQPFVLAPREPDRDPATTVDPQARTTEG